MKRTLGILLLCGILIAFSFWLGWGSRGHWSVVTGWSALSEEEQAWERFSEASHEKSLESPRLQWLGHATVGIDWNGSYLLTDPLSSGRVKIAPRLFDEPCVDETRLVDAVLITHAHMDHLDNPTLERLLPTTLYLPSGSERFLSEAVRRRHTVISVQIGIPFSVGALEIVPVPAKHGGWRYPWQWWHGFFACGYIVRVGPDSLYVAGDTAAGSHFQEIKDKYRPKYALLPIGAYSPEWFLRKRHLNPEEALAAADTLDAEFVVPYHFGTYRVSLEPVNEPLRRFAKEAMKRKQKWILPVKSDSEAR
jgi:L-ascorbate metabolism protein UlaG (beta-lactamase superfamily)